MCGAGDLKAMQLTQKEVPDPATQQRQQHLFGQAEQYAGGLSPFQQEYGYGQQLAPGLGGMSQTGQQYLTDKILGKGAYGYQSLGFQDYRRPEDAPVGGYQYAKTGFQPGDEFTAGSAWADRQTHDDYQRNPDTYFANNPDAVQPEGWDSWDAYTKRSWLENAETTLGADPSSTLPAAKMKTTQYAAVNQPGTLQNIWNVQGRDTLEGTRPEAAYYNQPSFGLQNVPTATSRDEYLAGTTGLLQTDLGRPTAGVGIGEIEDARTATRRLLLEQGRAGDPGYDQFLPGGWTGLGEAGTGTAAGDPSISRLGEEAVPDPTLIGTDFGVAAPTDITGIPGIAAQDIADFGEGYAGDAVTAGALTGTEPNVRVDPITGAVTQDVLGVAPTPIAAPGEVTVDPVTGEITEAVAGVTPSTFGGASFLGGNLDPYMNQLGVDAQVAAAQQDYLKAQNQEQARRAQSHAWGTRGDIPRAEQETAMLARIAEIAWKET